MSPAMSDALPPLPVAAHHGNGDFALSVIPYYTAKQMHEFAAAAVRAALAQAPQAAPTVPEEWVMVPVEPTEDMIEAARDVKRQRLLRAVEEAQAGRHPNTIGMAMACAEEWSAMLAAAPQEPQR